MYIIFFKHGFTCISSELALSEACQLMIDDPTNVECVNCLRAWHGACKPAHSAEVERQWFCSQCVKGINLPKGVKTEMSADYRRTFQRLRRYQLRAAPSAAPTEPSSSETPRRKRGRPKGSTKLSKVAVTDISLPSCPGLPIETCPEGIKQDGDAPKIVSPPHRTRNEFGSSPQRKSLLPDQPVLCSSTVGGMLFDVALAKMEEMGVDKKANLPKDKEQWVNLGGETDIKVLYESPYSDDIKSVPLFFICAYCLKPFSDQNSYFVHQDCCPRIAPPGREIYREADSSLSFFEVDGAVERTYCRNLCLLAMLFISSKISHNEVATFLFYILTKNDENGCRIVGYFSKEKNPSRNNNLSCLLTLPSEQRNGYGHLLIDMSYQLSCIERKVGSPEHPLSDLGLFTYRKYWKSSILCYLRSRKDATLISIKSMSLQTRIHPTDIVNELMRNNLLIMKDSNYFIKTWKLAFKFPLSMLRRRVVDPSRIKWMPDFDVTTLDPYKLNHYA
ncbi:MOZ/SAS family protein [Cooperia oncophora]